MSVSLRLDRLDAAFTFLISGSADAIGPAALPASRASDDLSTVRRFSFSGGASGIAKWPSPGANLYGPFLLLDSAHTFQKSAMDANAGTWKNAGPWPRGDRFF